MPPLEASARLEPGAIIAARELLTVTGGTVRIPDLERIVHLQFRRFAGCPVCNLHLHSIVQRHDEIAAKGIREIVVFHSPAGELRAHTADLPFAVIADPDKRLYTEFGVESAPRALLNPCAWGPIVRAITRGIRERAPSPSARPHGGRLGLPADFLIAGDGRVVACRYGEHVYDQWSVDEILDFAATKGISDPHIKRCPP